MMEIKNRKAFHDYSILEKFEAGIVLNGCEVKSVRAGKANLKDSYAMVKNEELFLLNCYIAPYAAGSYHNLETTRSRKLLLKKHTIKKLIGKINQKGMSLIPLCLYFKKQYLKVELGLAKAKKIYDKRETIKKKQQKRDMERDLMSFKRK